MTDFATLAAELLPASGTGPTGPGHAGAAGTSDNPAASRQVSWVRVLRARVPAFDALDPGDLVIAPATALAVVAPGRRELDEFIAALAAVPVSGVLLIAAEAGRPAGPPGTPSEEEAAAALAAAGVAVVSLSRTDPQALERSVVGYIVARGAELERRAALLEAELRRRALEGGGVVGLVAAVSSFLGRALALEAGRGDVIAIHAPVEIPAAAADAARYGARTGDESAVALRVPLPSASGPKASLLVLGAGPPSELARVTLPRVAGLLALELARDEAIRGAAAGARRAEPMPGGGPPWVVVLARQREPGGEDDAPASREARESARRALRLLAPARRLALRGDADSLEIRLVAAGAPDEVLALVRGIAEALERPVAVSRPFASPADRPAAEGEARATLEAALTLDEPPGVARADRLPIYRMLGALHKLPDGPRLALAVLEPLLDARPDVRRERLETLRALLAHGSIAETAAALGVHRNTVAYRVRAIEAATGWRLADPELRLPLAVAVRLVQDE